LYSDEQKKRCIVHYDTPPTFYVEYMIYQTHSIYT